MSVRVVFRSIRAVFRSIRAVFRSIRAIRLGYVGTKTDVCRVRVHAQTKNQAARVHIRQSRSFAFSSWNCEKKNQIRCAKQVSP
jgi:hypothetical protein